MTYSLSCAAGALAITGQAARRGASSFCAINTTALWFPVAPGTTSLPAAPAEVVNATPAAANQATLPPDWNDDAPDLCYLFQDILPVDVPPVFPVELTVSYVLPPFLETVEVVGIVKTKLVVSDLPYALALPGESVVAVTRTTLSMIDYSMTADAGSLAVDGQAVDMRQGWALAAGTGAMVITGQDAGMVLYPTAVLSAAAGTLAITGQDAGPFLLVADAGTLAITGQAATLGDSDPLFADVRILAHMDGSGTSYTDSSSYANTITAYGSATQSGSQVKYGAGATSFPDGSGVLYMNNTATALGTGNWSIELWARRTSSTGTSRRIVTLPVNTSSFVYLGMDSTGALNWSGFLSLSGATMSLNTWHYILIVNEADEITVWLDSTELVATGSYGPEPITGNYDFNNGVYIGQGNLTSGFNASIGFIGQVDELRITKAVRTGGTVPSAAFPNQ
jgi:hypothetical protein